MLGLLANLCLFFNKISLKLLTLWMLQLFAKFLDHPVHFCQTHSDAVRHSQTHKNFLIFRLSIDPVIVERCIIARWNRLVETNRMVANSSFYDRWIARYLTKRQESAFLHLHYCAI